MKLIVGLGNPEKKYEHTRHNVGFLVVDFFISNFDWRISDFQNNFNSLVLNAEIDNNKVILAKPQTFMNASGEAVQKICNFYKINLTENLLIIHDDVDLPLGEIRTTNSSSSAGHKGVQDIIDKLGTQDFRRIRIGVETRADKAIPPTDDYILQNFTDEELKKLFGDVFPSIKLEIKKFIGN